MTITTTKLLLDQMQGLEFSDYSLHWICPLQNELLLNGNALKMLFLKIWKTKFLSRSRLANGWNCKLGTINGTYANIIIRTLLALTIALLLLWNGIAWHWKFAKCQTIFWIEAALVCFYALEGQISVSILRQSSSQKKSKDLKNWCLVMAVSSN